MPAPSDHSSGFTLVELLAALGVATLLIALLLSVFESASRLWHETEDRIDAGREARAALGIMAADLQNAVLSPSSAGLPGLLQNSVPLPATAQTDTNIADSLFFLRSWPANFPSPEARGNLSQVGYFLAYGPATPGARESWNLYRYFQNSEATFQALATKSLFFFSTSHPVREELLARHVTGLRIAAYATNEAGALQPHSRASGIRPALVRITLTVLDHRTASLLANRSAWRETNSLLPSLQTFDAHFPLPP